HDIPGATRSTAPVGHCQFRPLLIRPPAAVFLLVAATVLSGGIPPIDRRTPATRPPREDPSGASAPGRHRGDGHRWAPANRPHPFPAESPGPPNALPQPAASCQPVAHPPGTAG